jgi:hypothetical protein
MVLVQEVTNWRAQWVANSHGNNTNLVAGGWFELRINTNVYLTGLLLLEMFDQLIIIFKHLVPSQIRGRIVH